MTVHDAQLDDIYVDKHGKLWRCVMTCHEPTVTFEAVEGYVPSSNPAANAAAQAMPYYPPSPQIVKPQQRGGISGLMFEGWKRIWRKEPTAA
jgi:hypothetical protein